MKGPYCEGSDTVSRQPRHRSPSRSLTECSTSTRSISSRRGAARGISSAAPEVIYLRNGVGKTTLRARTGQQPVAAGRISWQGEDARRSRRIGARGAASPMCRKGADSALTVRENLRPVYAAGAPSAPSLRMFRLFPCSRTCRRKAAICPAASSSSDRARLVMRPKLIVLDDDRGHPASIIKETARRSTICAARAGSRSCPSSRSRFREGARRSVLRHGARRGRLVRRAHGYGPAALRRLMSV